MKTTLCLILTLHIVASLAFVPNSFAQETSPEFTVRLIYFLPNDREPIPNIDDNFDAMMKDIQQYFADMMEYHGFERKTFRLETDATGKAIVHHIIGENNTEYYGNHRLAELGETQRNRFDIDTSKNIYLFAIDRETYSRYDDNHEPNVWGGSSDGGSFRGNAIFPAAAITGDTFASPGLIVHELGHAFGLRHDYDISRLDAVYFPGTDSIATVKMSTSFCAAEWLDAHRYFNADQTDQNIFNENTTVVMLPPSLAAPPDVIRFRFEIADPDGLHQVQFVSAVSLIGCEKLNGKSATVELVTTKLIDSVVVLLQVMDIHGNFKQIRFPIDTTSLPLPSPEVISIPDPNLASVIRETLDLAPDADITQLDMARLRKLTVENKQITDLTGLEHALRMNSLHLSRNQITDITPITGLTELIYLSLDENSIDDTTPLTGLTGLEYLYLYDNEISNITPLTGLTNVVDLSLDRNQISDITPLKGLTNVVDLSLNGNQISDITPLTGLTNVVDLSLNGNQISDITPLKGLTNVVNLSLAGNQISDIRSLAGLTNLKILNIYKNKIRDIIPLSGLTHLIYLDIAENEISNIKPLEGMTNMIFLFLQKNQIRDVNSLSGLTQLIDLFLNDNQISDVTPLVGLVNLDSLILVENPIKNKKPLLDLLKKNPNVKIYLKPGGVPLPVTLSHFRAEHTEAGVILNWTTESEIDNAGFYIYRSKTNDGEFKVVNPSMIQGAGTIGERNEYTWTDTTAKPNTVYYYQIGDVSHAGVRKQLATVRLRGLVSASGKLTTNWANLKAQ